MKRRPLRNQYLISIQQPGVWLLAAAGVVLFVIALCMGFYEAGRMSGGYDRSLAVEKEDILNARIEELMTENREIMRRNAAVLRDKKIDQGASGEVRQALADAQNKILEMKQELAFYHSIVSPGSNKRAINVQKISLVADKPGYFNYKMVAIQSGRNDRVARGKFELSVEGKRNGVQEWLSMKQLTVNKRTSRKFGFKYFQNFEGVLKIPDGFEPLSLRIRLIPRGSGIEKVEEIFVWADLTNRGKLSNVGQQ